MDLDFALTQWVWWGHLLGSSWLQVQIWVLWKWMGSGSDKNILWPRKGKMLYELTHCIWIWTLLWPNGFDRALGCWVQVSLRSSFGFYQSFGSDDNILLCAALCVPTILGGHKGYTLLELWQTGINPLDCRAQENIFPWIRFHAVTSRI